MRISDWSSDVCSSDLCPAPPLPASSRAPDGARRVAGALPTRVGRPARLARAAPAAHLQDAHLSHGGNRMSLPQPALYDGVIEPTADGGVIRFERRLAYPVDEVWDAVTNPERLADWWLPFDAAITVDLRVGGELAMAGRGDDAPKIGSAACREREGTRG